MLTFFSVSVCRYERPQKLFEDLVALGVTVNKKYPGIYNVIGLVYFPIQIMVLKKLSKIEYPELTMLNRSVSIENFGTFIKRRYSDPQTYGETKKNPLVLRLIQDGLYFK